MKRREVLNAVIVLAVLSVFCVASYGQTYIRASLPNPSNQPATGYRFELLTPGEVLEAVAQTNLSEQWNDSRFVNVTLRAGEIGGRIKGIRENPSRVSLPFARAVRPNERIDLRIAFKPKEYWRVYFNDLFQYADGHTERSRIPYAAFFISYEPTNDSAKKKATLTIVNNVGSSYGIHRSVVNDDNRPPITFKNARVYINNTMAHYTLADFDRPDGKRVDLPDAFSLKAGEAQTFDLGLVEAHTYILTLSEISYEGEEKSYPIACSHPDDGSTDVQAKIFHPQKQHPRENPVGEDKQ